MELYHHSYLAEARETEAVDLDTAAVVLSLR